MNRRLLNGPGIGAIHALVLTGALAASSCSNEAPGGTGGSSGATGATGGSGGTTGGAGGSSGTTGAAGGAGGTAGSISTGGAGGIPTNTGGAPQTGGAAGTNGATGGSSAGTTPMGGAGTGAGGMPTGSGGLAGMEQGGSPGGSAGSPAGGSAGAGTWWFNGPRAAPPIGTWPPPGIKLTQVVTGVTQPTAIAAPRADSTRLYVTEKWGRIRLIKDGVLVAEPALDMRAAVLEGGPQTGAELMNQGKRGLVGLAFHPNYAENGRIFVQYVADQGEQGVYGTAANAYDDGDMTFAEYKRSASDPDKFDPTPVDVFLQFDKGTCNQCSQHNGGSLEVDVDGFLWASTGDPPPYEDAGSQQLTNLNGKLLRFDISGTEVKAAGNYPGADPYVASIGIRNTYKFSVDRYTGDLYVGDVGENTWEEISVEKYGERNRDYGWPKREGKHRFMSDDCAGCLEPIYDYEHGGAEGSGADNCIVGGYVYRGAAIPALQGTYVYGDNGSGKLYAIQAQAGALTSSSAHNFPGLQVFMGCFGEDAAGEMYVCDYNNNKILRVDAQ
jgi:glucose/arabinose dehydrogenase